jgi:caffeoyl-CoA O-methyltransferase
MARSDRGYEMGTQDRAWIESEAEPVNATLAAIEAAAQPERIPILDRESGRVLAVLAAGRRRICEVGTAIGYSTLWMALAQEAGTSIVTIDPDRSRTDIARGFWRQAGIAIGRIEVVNRPALEAFAADDAALAGPFDLVFIDALKPEYRAYVEALVPRLARGALVVADNVLWSGRVSGAKPTAADDESTAALRAFDVAMLRDERFVTTILPVGDGLLVAHYRG